MSQRYLDIANDDILLKLNKSSLNALIVCEIQNDTLVIYRGLENGKTCLRTGANDVIVLENSSSYFSNRCYFF